MILLGPHRVHMGASIDLYVISVISLFEASHGRDGLELF